MRLILERGLWLGAAYLAAGTVHTRLMLLSLYVQHDGCHPIKKCLNNLPPLSCGTLEAWKRRPTWAFFHSIIIQQTSNNVIFVAGRSGARKLTWGRMSRLILSFGVFFFRFLIMASYSLFEASFLMFCKATAGNNNNDVPNEVLVELNLLRSVCSYQQCQMWLMMLKW